MGSSVAFTFVGLCMSVSYLLVLLGFGEVSPGWCRNSFSLLLWTPSCNWIWCLTCTRRLQLTMVQNIKAWSLVFLVYAKNVNQWSTKRRVSVPTIERKSESKKESIFFPFVIILHWAKWELGIIGALGLSGFLALFLSYTHLLIVDFLRFVFANGCRLVKPNHLNLCVVCDCLIFVILHSSYFSHLTGLGK